MNMHRHLASDDRKFVLPPIPEGLSPELAAAISDYRSRFGAADEEAAEQWDRAALAIHAFQPQTLADLAAKLIVSIHYSDPEMTEGQFTIGVPEAPVDRLAAEMEIRCVEQLLECVPADATPFPAAAPACVADAVDRYRAVEKAQVGYISTHGEQEGDQRAEALWNEMGEAYELASDFPAATLNDLVAKIEMFERARDETEGFRRIATDIRRIINAPAVPAAALDWTRALAHFRNLEAIDVEGLPDPAASTVTEAMGAAMDHLVGIPAPTADALILKIELARDRWDGFSVPDDWFDAFAADAAALGRGIA
jgi:hypothetical protein